jgi:uncharacterized protein (DUF2252 family)
MKKTSQNNTSPRFSSAAKVGATRAERKAFGKLARQNAPLESHAKLHIPQSGRDIIAVLEKSNIGRVQELVPIRYGRMLASPFTFYRGSAALMALDLAGTPTSGCIVQACGDCHIQNFGVFATPERKTVVDINDFDETLPAPWEWDVKRLAASLVLAATANEFSADLGQEAAFIMARAYREHIAELSSMTLLEAWYSHVQTSTLLELSKSETRKRQEKLLKEALAKSSPEILMEKLTVTSSGKVRFKDIPPLLCHMEGVSAGVQEKAAFEAYRNTLPEDRRVLLDKFEMVDIARKVVGIGSVGTLCGVILLASSEQDMLVLQLKEARQSVLEPYAGKSKYDHHGHRVVSGQKLMQAASDMFLGWTTGPRPPHRHFYIRQLRDVKVGANTALWDKADFKILPALAGRILARAHARTGDASFLRGYLGKTNAFEEAVSSYAIAYAIQTERDFRQFVKACKSGELNAQSID